MSWQITKFDFFCDAWLQMGVIKSVAFGTQNMAYDAYKWVLWYIYDAFANFLKASVTIQCKQMKKSKQEDI